MENVQSGDKSVEGKEKMDSEHFSPYRADGKLVSGSLFEKSLEISDLWRLYL